MNRNRQDIPAPSMAVRRIIAAGAKRAALHAHRASVMAAARQAERDRRTAAIVSADADYSRMQPIDWLRADEARGLLPTDTATIRETVALRDDGGIKRGETIATASGAMVKLERLYHDHRAVRSETVAAMRETNVKPLADIRASEPWKASDKRRMRRDGRRIDWHPYRVLADGTRERFETPAEALIREQRQALRDATPQAVSVAQADVERQEREARIRATVAHLTAGID